MTPDITIIGEAEAQQRVSLHDAIAAVECAFVALHRNDATVFPVMMAHGTDSMDRFGVKAGTIRPSRLTGLKIGSYWPSNRSRGLASHGSTTVLLDDGTGMIRAIIASAYLTALRTAAADALAVRHLARSDAGAVAIVGAGHQAWFDLLAIGKVRQIRSLKVWNRTAERAQRFAARARDELGLAASSTSLEEAVSGADIVVTATAAREPLVESGWVRPGAHVSAMGADGPGKQELSVELAKRARLFADVPAQAISLGEFESAFRSGAIRESDIQSLGAVVAGDAPGRRSLDDITIFDSSGFALQDLEIAEAAMRSSTETTF